MKYLKIYLIAILLVSIGGCDFLKYDEDTSYHKNDVFQNFGRTKQFLANIYSRIPAGLNSVGGAMRSSGADNSEEVNDGESVQRYNNGTWSAIYDIDSKWNDMYVGIRAANRFLQEFDINNFDDTQYNDDYPEVIQQAKLYPAQARFLRAYFYFKLLKRYGHIPLITDLLTPETANKVQPSSYDEVADFIVQECNAIIPELPVEYESLPEHEIGRATRGTAMALKARVLLYSASPLHNSGGDQQKWIDAAKAAKAIIDSSYYSLDANYNSAFNNLDSSELIWGREKAADNSFERANFPVGYEGADPGTSPTQNLVDSYEMQSTGLPIDNAAAGYDPASPYEGRDPRLKQTVIVNNSNWKGRSVQIWNGGKDGPPKFHATKTGYYLKKYVVEGVRLDPGDPSVANHEWVIFRYGEVLLNYAEAMNEAYGPDNPANMGMTATQAVNKIRQRSNMPNFPAGMTKEGFREKVHNERRVELAFENQRFWDIRRWKIGPSTTEIKGMEIIKNDDGSFTYNRKTVEERVWNNRMYLYPIPQNETFNNSALEQNPGW